MMQSSKKCLDLKKIGQILWAFLGPPMISRCFRPRSMVQDKARSSNTEVKDAGETTVRQKKNWCLGDYPFGMWLIYAYFQSTFVLGMVNSV